MCYWDAFRSPVAYYHQFSCVFLFMSGITVMFTHHTLAGLGVLNAYRYPPVLQSFFLQQKNGVLVFLLQTNVKFPNESIVNPDRTPSRFAERCSVKYFGSAADTCVCVLTILQHKPSTHTHTHWQRKRFLHKNSHEWSCTVKPCARASQKGAHAFKATAVKLLPVPLRGSVKVNL